MRNSIPIDDILYELPEKPEKKKILFSDKPKREQKWRRAEFPHDWDTWTENQKFDYIDLDLERRTNGVWMMICGEPVYITGHHYFYLQWWYIGADTHDGYPEYREANLHDFYFWDYCEKDPNCYGDIYLTSKRAGKTESRMAIAYNRTTLNENAHAGLQSISGSDAKENLFINRIVRSFKMIPHPLTPEYDGNRDPKKVLRFTAAEKKGAKAKNTKFTKSLNSYIDFEETSETAYQGRKMHTIILDEPGTIQSMDLGLWWQTHKKQLALGPKIYGKASLATTIENMNDRGGKQYMDVWINSDPKEKDANGRTKSGLYRHFKPAYIGMEGFIDEYGRDIKEKGEYKAKIFLENERKGADALALSRLKRQFPFTIEEAFDIAYGDVWESDVIEILKHTRRNIMSSAMPIKKVKLYEINGEINLTPSSDEYSVQIFEEPKSDCKYYAGFDGAGSDKTTGGEKGSKVAIVVLKGFSMSEAYQPVAIFSVRPERMEEAYQVVYLLCRMYNKFGGLKLLGETNAGQGSAMVAYFTARGGQKMLMDRPKTLGVNFEDKSSKKWIYRGKEVKELQILLSNRFLRRFGMNIKFIELVNSLINYGKANEDFSDAFMMAVLGMGDWEKQEKKVNVSSSVRWKRVLKRDGSGRTVESWVQV